MQHSKTCLCKIHLPPLQLMTSSTEQHSTMLAPSLLLQTRHTPMHSCSSVISSSAPLQLLEEGLAGCHILLHASADESGSSSASP